MWLIVQKWTGGLKSYPPFIIKVVQGLLCLYFQGKEVIEYYINELLSEGITYIPPWTDPNR